MNYAIGIDVGTTGTKTLLIDETGRVRASAAAGYRLNTPAPGWAEQDPAWWARAAAATVRRVLEDSGVAPARVAGVSLSGQMHGLVALDAGGKVLCPAILWCDQRTSAARAWIEHTIGEDRFLKAVLNPPLEGFTAPKLVWLRENRPGLFRKMAGFLLPKDFVRYRLTGSLCTEESDAAGTALFDVANAQWAWDLLEPLGLDASLFPAVRRSVDIAGFVTSAAAKRTGLLEGTPVIAGGADNTCAAIGAGVVRQGRVCSSIGSSGVIFAHTDSVRSDPEARLHTFNHSVPGKWYLMGVMLGAGLSLKWFRDTFGQRESEIEKRTGRDAYAQLARLAQKSSPGADGVLFLPYLNGERTPHKNPHARGVFCGISQATRREHMIRAVFEGVTLGLKDSLDLIEGAAGFKVRDIRATGGGARSPFWLQLQADVFGRPVSVLEHDQGPAFGAALLAATGAGLFQDIVAAANKTVKVRDAVRPDPHTHKFYSDLQKEFRSLYGALEPVFTNR